MNARSTHPLAHANLPIQIFRRCATPLALLLLPAGGVITIPLLARCNVPLRQAIGTSAAFGLPVAVTATVGYIWSGLGKDALPPHTLGYVFLPALAAVLVGR